MATITKRELATRVTNKVIDEHPEITQQAIVAILQLFIDEIADSLAVGDRVVMRRFGTFEVREMKAKLGRNPKFPSATVKIPARAGVKFKPGNELKDKVATSLKVIREREKTNNPASVNVPTPAKAAKAAAPAKAVKATKTATAAKTSAAAKTPAAAKTASAAKAAKGRK